MSNPIHKTADGIVGVVRYGYHHRAWLSALALVAVMVVAVGYLLFGARIYDYSSISNAMFALFRTILGDFD